MTTTASATTATGKIRIKHAEMRQIVKRFPGVLANDHVDFDVRAGEIHALLGENGAGKSTLMKILYGLYQQDEGEIALNGETVQIHSPSDAIRLGIGMIHQHFMLVPSLPVVENVALGLPSSREPLTELDRVAARIEELASAYGLRVDPFARVWQLSVGQQQRVEIIKALYRGADLLILDEPTAVLTPQEVEEFFQTLKQMAAEGHSLIFISHKLHEVMDISDRVSVLRDGKLVGRVATEETSKRALAEMMVGRELSQQLERGPVNLGETRLKVENIHALSDRETPALQGVSLEVRAGEILGLAGVSGNGQRELAEVIAGLREATQGKVFLGGDDVTGMPPSHLIEKGLSYIPEERMKDGMIREFTVSENLILRDHQRKPYSRTGFLNFGTIRNTCVDLVSSFNVKTPSLETPAKSLSGGNIQKLILARELSRGPKVVIAAQPTRGLDIGAIEYVHKTLVRLREEGIATLLISEDLDEILALADRIAVIYEGRIMGTLSHDEATAEELGLMMAGVVHE
ncbi:MAG: ABC transporter ATP-binding protein [Chloroflexota bacterium]